MKNKFEAPELIVILIDDKDDIITTSALGLRYGANGDEWQDLDA